MDQNNSYEYNRTYCPLNPHQHLVIGSSGPSNNNLGPSIDQQRLLHLQQSKTLTHGREEFGGLDNETLDFSQLEDFITDESDANGSYFADTLANSEASKHTSGGPPPPPTTPRIVIINQNQSNDGSTEFNSRKGHGGGAICSFPSTQLPHNLPDSPPDSGSEPPYSPTDPGSRSPHQKGGPSNGTRNIHDLLSRHQLFQQGGGVPGPTILSIGDLPSIGSPIPHLTPLRGPSLIPITPSPTNPNTSPTTLTTLGPPQPPPAPPSQVLISQQGQSINSGGPQSLDPIPPFYTPLQPVNGENVRGRKRKASNGSQPIGKLSLALVKQEMGSNNGPTISELSPSDSNSSNHNTGSGINGSSSSGQGDEDFGFEFSGDPSVYLDGNYQCIKFQPFQESTWNSLLNESFKELPLPYYKVDADKGFNFSNADDAFVCQKKNHFQVTCHTRQNGEPKYVRSSDGYKPIDNFYLHFYGVKVESPNQTIKIEQSQSDRSKKPFHPVMVDMTHEQTVKVTIGRLHFNETTSNNMRKKGKPNPDQRYFYLVVALQAHCPDGIYPIIAHSSQRIIVRASNPGQFESDMELTWQKGQTSDSVYHAGRVGINTDRPDEALVVYGNCKITGQITHPSDSRAKHDITEVDTKEQLRNVQQLRVVRYKYNPEFARLVGLPEDAAIDTGVIAQEVQKVIPDAVKETGNLELENGTQLQNFLVVNKERIFMENIGAVKELCKVTGKLENRIDQLERITYSNRSESKEAGSPNRARTNLSRSSSSNSRNTDKFLCSNKSLQWLIFALVIIMALCLTAMATLYILEYQKRSSIEQSINLTSPDHLNLKTTKIQQSTEKIQIPAYLPISSTGDSGRSNGRSSGVVTGGHSEASKLYNKIYSKSGSGWINPVKNHLPSEVSVPVIIQKPVVLGRPVNCPVYLSLPPCKIYCCPGSNLQETSNFDYEYLDRGNQVSSTSIGSLEISESANEVHRRENGTEKITVKTNSGYGTPSTSVVSGNLSVQRNNGLENKRRKRQVHDIPKLLNVPSVHLVSEHINQSLDSSYCMINSEGYHDCVSTQNRYFVSANLTYGIPLSKYWDGLSVSLVFNISSKFDVSQPSICEKMLVQHSCSLNDSPSPDENKVDTEPTIPTTSVKKLDRNVYSVAAQIGSSPFSKVKLRFAPMDFEDDEKIICSLSSSTSKFFEFTFYFYRVCDG